MVKIEKVLCSTDFSAYGEAVLEHAASVAQKYNAKLYLLHVIRNPADRIYGKQRGDYHALIEGAKKKCNELMTGYTDKVKDLNPGVIIKEGDPVYEILRVIDEEKIDLAVIGSHGEGPVEHLLMGSNCDKLVRTAPCPVLVIRGKK